MQNPEPLVYSVPEAIEELKVSRAHLNRLFKSGDLPSLKIGNRRLVRRVDLLAFLADRVGQ